MTSIHRAIIAAAVLVAAPLIHAQASESNISKRLNNIADVPEAQRPAAILKLAEDVSALPAAKSKVKLADTLSQAAIVGDAGHDTLQAVADAFSKSLAETPFPAKGDKPPAPYMDLAKLVRYEVLKTTLNDPLYTGAAKILADQDAEIEKADFTLKDINGKKVTFSALRGKIILINFWTTSCKTCITEMASLDPIYTHLEPQGLEILSITNDPDFMKVATFVTQNHYHPPVLVDTGGKVTKQFHVDGVPRSFVFNREGKLVAVGLNQRTQLQFLAMLTRAGLHR